MNYIFNCYRLIYLFRTVIEIHFFFFLLSALTDAFSYDTKVITNNDVSCTDRLF